MANYLTTDTDLTAVADAIREKGGTSGQLAFPSGFVDAIDAIETGGGDSAVLNKLIDRSITAIAFDGNEIGPHAFHSCKNLSSISFPNATTVGEDAFNGTAITEIVQTQFPKFRRSSSRTFASMQHLTRVFLPEVFIGQFGLSDCTKLKTAVIAGILNTHVFSSSTLLEAADFLGVSIAIGLSVFYKTAISLLILRANTLIALGTIGAFTNSPFASDGTGGTLYVPQALIADYQAATNWSTILSYPNNQILPIEGSIYETQYADGTPIT